MKGSSHNTDVTEATAVATIKAPNAQQFAITDTIRDRFADFVGSSTIAHLIAKYERALAAEVAMNASLDLDENTVDTITAATCAAEDAVLDAPLVTLKDAATKLVFIGRWYDRLQPGGHPARLLPAIAEIYEDIVRLKRADSPVGAG